MTETRVGDDGVRRSIEDHRAREERNARHGYEMGRLFEAAAPTAATYMVAPDGSVTTNPFEDWSSYLK